MQVFHLASFKKDFVDLPKKIKKITEQKLKMFANNPSHPSLRVKKMQGWENVWEARINKTSPRLRLHIFGFLL